VLRILLLVVALLLGGSLALSAAPSAADPPRGQLRIVVFGDFNGPYGALEYPSPVSSTVRAIVDVWRPDLVLMPGDLVAGQSASLPAERFAAMWAVFDREVAEPLRRAGIPYAATMGNHDASSLRDASGRFVFARERDAARTAWASWPDHAVTLGLALIDAADPPFHYAFTLGPALVAVIDASSATVGAAQRAWLRDVLDSPAARAAELRLVMGHLPLYPLTVGRDRPGEYLTDGDALRELLEGFDVHAYVSGHHAAYYPGRVGELELLFAGGVGGRRILGHDAAPRSAVTIVDVDLDPLVVRYTSFDPGTMQRIQGTALPEVVEGGGTIIRRSERGLP
jgi:3',5'-cyclic AMP phosphodiesterase CpdA